VPAVVRQTRRRFSFTGPRGLTGLRSLTGLRGALITTLRVWAATLAKVPLAIGVAVPAVFFVSMGRGLRSAPDRFRRWPLGAVLLAIGVAAVVSGLDTPLDLKVGNFGRPVIGVVTALVISTGLIFCSESMSAQIGRATPWVSSAVARFGPAVILAHGLPLDLSRSVTSSLLRLAVVAAGTAVMVWLAARSPWSERLLGPHLRAR
jgi:acyltransferase